MCNEEDVHSASGANSEIKSDRILAGLKDTLRALFFEDVEPAQRGSSSDLVTGGRSNQRKETGALILVEIWFELTSEKTRLHRGIDLLRCLGWRFLSYISKARCN